MTKEELKQYLDQQNYSKSIVNGHEEYSVTIGHFENGKEIKTKITYAFLLYCVVCNMETDTEKSEVRVPYGTFSKFNLSKFNFWLSAKLEKSKEVKTEK